jgi:hypothetical protein
VIVGGWDFYYRHCPLRLKVIEELQRNFGDADEEAIFKNESIGIPIGNILRVNKVTINATGITE